MHPFAKAALGAVAAAYANHALVKPGRVASLARTYANRVRKPMLAIVPPPGATMKSVFREQLALGDVNLHHASRTVASGPGQVGRGSPYRIPVGPRTFGSLFSCDTLEHLDRPDLALLEWHRVADRVFIVTPPWWTPEAWFSRWYIDPELKRAWPVWAKQNRTIWLPSNRVRAYDAGTCPTPPRLAPATRPTTATTRPSPQPAPPTTFPAPQAGLVSNESAPGPVSLPVVSLLPSSSSEEPDYRTEEELPSESPSDLPYLPPIVDSPSSTSVSSMMIVSGPETEND